MVLGLIGAVVLAHGSLLKAIAMIVLGLLLGIVGTDVNSGVARFDFGIPELSDGIGVVGVAMGLFGFAEIIINLESTEKRELVTTKVRGCGSRWQQFKRGMPGGAARHRRSARCSALLPGGGAMLSSFASYALEKKIAKDPSQFGKGAIQGVAGPESANNAGAQTSFIPLLTLGIPENAVMAMMVGAMTIHNIQPGPQVMTSNPQLFWGLDRVDVGRQPDARRAEPAADRHLDQAADGAVPAAVSGHPAVLRDRRVHGQQHQLRRHADGVLRLARRLFVKLECEPAPLLLGFVLGPMMEENLRRALLLSRGDPTVFATRPISRGTAGGRDPARAGHRAAEHPPASAKKRSRKRDT